MGLKGSDSCLAKAADDEPIFVLRAQDRLAAILVWQWADLAELHGADAAKVREARDLASQMLAWQRAGGGDRSKWPD